MAVLLWSGIILLVATILHILVWRLRLPRRHTRALLFIYFGTWAAFLAVLVAVPAGAVAPQSWPEYVQLSLLVAAAVAAYVISYSAVEAESPTLVMVRALEAAGPEGLAEEAFHDAMSDDVLLKPRLDDLVRDGMLQWIDGRYHVTPKGRAFVRIFIVHRDLLGLGKGG